MARHAKGRRHTVAAPAPAKQPAQCATCCSPTPRLMIPARGGLRCPVCLEVTR